MADLESILRKLHHEKKQLEEWSAKSHSDAILSALQRYRRLAPNAWDDVPQQDRLATITSVVSLDQFQAFRDEVDGHLSLTQQLLRLCRTTFVPPYKRSGAATSSEDVERRRAVLDDYEHLRTALRDLVGHCTEDIASPLESLVEQCGGQSVLNFMTAANNENPGESIEEGAQVLQFVEMRCVDKELEEAKRRDMLQIAQELHEVRVLQEESQRLIAAQGEGIDFASQDTAEALNNAVKSRMELTMAAKYKVAGATLTGALVGGLIGGPVGLVAGAKSAATIALAAAAGAATGGVAVRTVVSASTARASALDEDYDDRPRDQ